MNPSSLLRYTLLAVGAWSLPLAAEAKDHHDKHDRGDRYNRNRVVYYTRPSSTFSVTLGNGYAGRGYYYGPQGATYYHQRPGVVYYRTRDAVPRSYFGTSSGYETRLYADVQRALSRRGYYRGDIDGVFGPESRRAVARYQRDNDLRPTGSVDNQLLRSLNLS
jgi:hypothetical protein